NNLGGVPLATVMWAAGNHLPLAISLHDPGLLDTLAGFNRWLTGRVGLVISPTHDLLDQHLDRGFFRRAIRQILPYGIEPAPPPAVCSTLPRWRRGYGPPQSRRCGSTICAFTSTACPMPISSWSSPAGPAISTGRPPKAIDGNAG